MSECMVEIIMWRLEHYACVSYFIQSYSLTLYSPSLDALCVSE